MSWPTSEDGNFYVFDGVVHVPREFDGSNIAVMLRPSGGMETLPLLPVEMVKPWYMPERQPGDIIDEIDQLVDEQMAGGEQPAYDYGWQPTRYPQCPHCGRHWHGLALTERIAAMYACGSFDEDYLLSEDASRVLCQGSEFIGPMPAQSPRLATYTDFIQSATWVESPAWTVVVGGSVD